MDILELPIEGCYLIKYSNTKDARGKFTKIFNETSFAEKKLETKFVESYVTQSKKNVIRGMHFQKPPYEYVKLITCTEGAVQDGIVDLRKSSKTYLKSYSMILNSKKGEVLYLTKGIAHGFLGLAEKNVLNYMVSAEYNKDNDIGVHWQTVNIEWKKIGKNKDNRIISERDRKLMPLNEYLSNFE
jgi:dTDP-4-dehydrorhamnose 3,5-epimerase